MSMDWMLQSKDIECHTGLKKKKKKARANNMLPKKDPPQGKGHTQIVKEAMEKKVFHGNGNDKKVGVTIQNIL